MQQMTQNKLFLENFHDMKIFEEFISAVLISNQENKFRKIRCADSTNMEKKSLTFFQK